MARFVELSHVITAGMVTYPGLPGPEVTPHVTRESSRELYAPGTEFVIDWVRMLGNTGTYLDSPFHRHADGVDLAGLPLDELADLRLTRRGVLVHRLLALGFVRDDDVTAALAELVPSA